MKGDVYIAKDKALKCFRSIYYEEALDVWEFFRGTVIYYIWENGGNITPFSINSN